MAGVEVTRRNRRDRGEEEDAAHNRERQTWVSGGGLVARGAARD